MNNEQQCAYPTGHDGDPGLTKLEAFTLAAMKGICANNYNDMPIDVIAEQAVVIARATLSTLQNEQK